MAATIAAENLNVDVKSYVENPGPELSWSLPENRDHLTFVDMMFPLILGIVALISVVYFVLVWM